jgi:hypothetical protein
VGPEPQVRELMATPLRSTYAHVRRVPDAYLLPAPVTVNGLLEKYEKSGLGRVPYLLVGFIGRCSSFHDG